MKPIVIDFETEPIGDGWVYPPKPVGISIFLPHLKKPKYYAWGHPTENNCSYADGLNALQAVWAAENPVLCHNAKFDLDVAVVHLGLAMLPWERIHDTMFLLFLDNPHSPSLSLKPSAQRLLGMAPEEQDAILQWAISEKLLPRNAKNAGALIYLAPGALVGKYANGDTLRTRKLFELLYPKILARGMLPAYNRELRLLPVLLKNENEGVRVDLKLLAADGAKYEQGQLDADAWLRKTLKSKELNIDSDAELADALVAAGKADEGMFLLTPKGKRSTAKDSLIGAVTDQKVLGVLQYRSKLATAYGTFIKPWLIEAQTNKGIIRPRWNQVRQSGAVGTAGARTGRLSASRFMNTPKPYQEEEGKYQHPAYAKVPELPIVRRYLLPDRGEVWCKRDYSQQELRVLGHFEDGVLLGEFMADFASTQDFDVHQLAGDILVNQYGMFNGNRKLARTAAKTIGFGLLYGMGLGALAERLEISVYQAQQIRAAYLDIFPGLKDLQNDLTERGKQGLPLKTWGGREYYVEEAKYVAKFKRVQTFEYKLLNYLIQGSSADCTKEAIIRYDAAKQHGRFLITIHDEINLSVPKSKVKSEMALLRDVMASIEFDTPMLSDGAIGPNWAELIKFNEPLYQRSK